MNFHLAFPSELPHAPLHSHHCFLLGSPASEAPCKHLVELAQAEVRANPNVSLPMREFSGIRLNDAENGVHRLFKKYNLVPPVKIHDAELALGREHRKFPYIKLSTWVQYLLDSDQLHRQFVGVRTFKIMRHVLEEFWDRYRAMDPSFLLFEMADCGEVDLSTCIPFYSHSDEGRSYKHLGLWILSSHGLLGRGTSGYLKSGLDKLWLSEPEMGLNFTGKTWATQYIFTSMIKTVYSKYPEAQNEMVRLFTGDVVDLFFDGISSRDREHRVHMIHMGHQGDLPALVRMMDAKRSYSHVPRGPTSRKACDGVCHLCLAGVEQGDTYPESVPFEETLHLIEPWDHTPDILIGMPLAQLSPGCISTLYWIVYGCHCWKFGSWRSTRIHWKKVRVAHHQVPAVLPVPGPYTLHQWDLTWYNGFSSRYIMSHCPVVQGGSINRNDDVFGQFLQKVHLEQNWWPIVAFHRFFYESGIGFLGLYCLVCSYVLITSLYPLKSLVCFPH